MIDHLQEHGNRNWSLVRERQDFAPFIGAVLGPSADRKFKRWKAALPKRLLPNKTRPHEDREMIEEHQDWARATAATVLPCAALPVTPTPANLMAQGRSALRGYDMLGASLQQSAKNIERLLRIALTPDPEGVDGFSAADPELLAKVIRLEHEHGDRVMAFLAQYNRFQAGEDFLNDLMEVIETQLSDSPEQRQRVINGLREMFQRPGGALQ